MGARDQAVLHESLENDKYCCYNAGLLRGKWAPHAFVVSFKLETNASILVHKVGPRLALLIPFAIQDPFPCKQAVQSLNKYGVHVVVANELTTRAATVLLVSRKQDLGIAQVSGLTLPLKKALFGRCGF